MSEHKHTPGLFGICTECGEQTDLWLVPVKMVTREQMEERFPSPSDSANEKHE
jgi:hypothetical protein